MRWMMGVGLLVVGCGYSAEEWREGLRRSGDVLRNNEPGPGEQGPKRCRHDIDCSPDGQSYCALYDTGGGMPQGMCMKRQRSRDGW